MPEGPKPLSLVRSPAQAGPVASRDRGRWVVAYGHAERALAAIQALEAETAELLCSLPQLDAEQLSWLEEIMGAGPQARRMPADLGRGGVYETRALSPA
jgi:hypothetical protein